MMSSDAIFRMARVTVASGDSLSSATDLSGLTIVGIMVPGAWTTAKFSFQAGWSIDNMADVYDDISGTATERTVAAVAGTYIPCFPSSYAGFKCLKIRSGTASVPVAQTGTRNIVLVCRSL